MTQRTTPIPFSAPGGPNASVVATGVVTLALLDVWSLSVRGSPPAALAAMVLVIGSVFASRATSIGRSLAISVGAGSIGTTVLAVLPRLHGPIHSDRIIGALMVGAFVGVIMAPAPASVAHARSVRSFDAFNAVLAASGIWLAIIGATFAAPMLIGETHGIVRHLLSGHAFASEWLALISIAVGIVLASAALLLQHRRMRWIADVYAEKVPGWRIVKASEHPADTSRWTLLESVQTRDGLLVRERAEGREAFRSIAGAEPVAIVDLEPTMMLRAARQHATRLVAAVAVVWIPVLAWVVASICSA